MVVDQHILVAAEEVVGRNDLEEEAEAVELQSPNQGEEEEEEEAVEVVVLICLSCLAKEVEVVWLNCIQEILMVQVVKEVVEGAD